ncbi:MAG TPA: UDP-N-acetylmuramoyl-tripeptide--D-alanyl-D-alanine ligase [Candidatus Paceibacterota bacterium]|nr:UDP-N-acetylmuramoyl-tripeptide--D-alanyl-D-alanine ligase [Candidatus Paceibacterota bacterium]
MMDNRPLSFIVEGSQGRLLQGDPSWMISGVCLDSRQVQPGDLFVAIQGPRFDGHAFVGEAGRRQAAAALLHRTPAEPPPTLPAIVSVDNTRLALGRLASRYRQDFQLPAIAVCGSNGKTTTKDILASILSQRFLTLRSPASFNNDIGVPLTLLDLHASHQAAILEAGTNHPGELLPLLSMIRPRFGILTSIGREHLEFFGSLEGVIAEEAALAAALPHHGRLFLPADLAGLDLIASRAAAPLTRVGWGPAADWQAADVSIDWAGTRFRILQPEGPWAGSYHLPIPGRHQAINALLAIALAAELGLTPEEARAGLAAFTAPAMRLQTHERRGVRFLNDAYNANPDSTRAALETLRCLPAPGRRIAVLGDFAELGDAAESAHRETGRLAAGLQIDLLVAVGAHASVTAQSARQHGLDNVRECATLEDARSCLGSLLRPGDLVLLKASRSAGLERLLDPIPPLSAHGLPTPPSQP